MKFLVLILTSFSIQAASLVDVGVDTLLRLNGTIDKKITNQCATGYAMSACHKTSELKDGLDQYVDCESKYKGSEILNTFLSNDSTDKRAYVLDAKSPDWYVCQHFSTQAFMRGSCFANSEYNKAYEEHTNIEIENQESELKNKLPIFYVNINSASNGFYHAINAIFIGDSVDELGNIDNYIFFEPQSDELFYSIDEVRKKYSHYNLDTAKDLELGISVMNKPTYTTSGSLQFRTEHIVDFKCDLFSN